MTETESLVALNSLPKIGPVKITRLLERFTTATAALSASTDQLSTVEGIGPETANLIHDWESHTDPVKELSTAQERGIHIITRHDPTYPTPLRNHYDSPALLYVWGQLTEKDNHALAIVGSRRVTHYGRQTAQKFAFQLAHAGLTIISGLARGIDTAAHEGAIAAGGRTIAVIGSGLLQLYPPENMGLAEKIADGNGAVVSEFPLHAKPDKKRFPQRNRVVAGWSEGLLVVECPARSGSLITANLAAEYGRQVYAVPGQIDRPTSQGCHDLIRSGATLVTDGAQILDDLSHLSLSANPLSEKKTLPINLTADEAKIITALDKDELTIDELITRASLTPSVVSTTLLLLEMKGQVKTLPGQRYVRIF